MLTTQHSQNQMPVLLSLKPDEAIHNKESCYFELAIFRINLDKVMHSSYYRMMSHRVLLFRILQSHSFSG